MQDPYDIKFEEISLEKIYHILESGSVLPARQGIKGDFDEWFGILTYMGIRNLSDLIRALSTKQKLSNFS